MGGHHWSSQTRNWDEDGDYFFPNMRGTTDNQICSINDLVAGESTKHYRFSWSIISKILPGSTQLKCPECARVSTLCLLPFLTCRCWCRPSPGHACLQHLDCCSCWPHHRAVNEISWPVSHIRKKYLNMVIPPWIGMLVHIVKHLTSPF